MKRFTAQFPQSLCKHTPCADKCLEGNVFRPERVAPHGQCMMMVLFLGFFHVRVRLDPEVIHGVRLAKVVPLQEKSPKTLRQSERNRLR